MTIQDSLSYFSLYQSTAQGSSTTNAMPAIVLGLNLMVRFDVIRATWESYIGASSLSREYRWAPLFIGALQGCVEKLTQCRPGEAVRPYVDAFDTEMERIGFPSAAEIALGLDSFMRALPYVADIVTLTMFVAMGVIGNMGGAASGIALFFLALAYRNHMLPTWAHAQLTKVNEFLNVLTPFFLPIHPMLKLFLIPAAIQYFDENAPELSRSIGIRGIIESARLRIPPGF